MFTYDELALLSNVLDQAIDQAEDTDNKALLFSILDKLAGIQYELMNDHKMLSYITERIKFNEGIDHDN